MTEIEEGGFKFSFFELIRIPYDADADGVVGGSELPLCARAHPAATADGEGVTLNVLRSVGLVTSARIGGRRLPSLADWSA